MRALFITWPWNSHFYPMAPLGWALRAAGHDVMVASQPSFAPTITGAGLPALPVGPDLDIVGQLSEMYRGWRPENDRAVVENSPHRKNGIVSLYRIAESAEAMAEEATDFARQWRPDFVVFEPMAFLGPVLASALGVPSMRLLWATDSSAKIARIQDEMLGGLAQRIGADRVNLVGDLTLDPCPPRLRRVDPRVTGTSMRYIPYNGPAELPLWLRTPPSRPRILVTWGGSLFQYGWNEGILAPRVVRALADQDVEVVVAVHGEYREMFTDLPANVVHVGPVALHLLLPSCAAIVHQGGAGTTMTAVSSGTPQFVVPWWPDAIVNARQVEATGSGRHLWPVDLEDATLKEALCQFVADLPDYQNAATRLQDEHLALPTPAEVVTQIERDSAAGTGLWAARKPA
ncbi:DUF1205 domain-containing protein [Streptomyces rameus]|uniref:DUF1205 domain-containing protein n=1 Tax=Streptomyces rameus TaxID=68261 RepID=A0ABN3V1P8_9ACTN